MDGVPTKFDRSESLESFSLSFLHLETSAENKHIRLPLTLLNKSFFLKSGETIHAIFKILCWSFHACLQNYFPTVDEHGHEHTSNWRRKKAGQELGAFGLLLEIRGGATGCVTSRHLACPIGQRNRAAAVGDAIVRPNI